MSSLTDNPYRTRLGGWCTVPNWTQSSTRTPPAQAI